MATKVSSSNLPLRRSEVSSHVLDDELVLYDPTSGRAHVLNSTAAQVWSRCDGAHSVEAVAEELASLYALDHERVLGDVNELVRDLRRARLLAEP